MRALSAAELMEAWELAFPVPAASRPLVLLGAVCPELPLAALARLPLGQRDALLLALRERTFGSRVEGLAPCPGCGERVELGFDVAELPLPPTPSTLEPLAVALGRYSVRFRLPDTEDLVALRAREVLAGRRELLERCVLEASLGDAPVAPAELPEEVVRAVAEEMERVDPRGGLELAVTCPCGHAWPVAFDIGAFLWCEVEAWAHRTLREVDTLAARYGWSEEAILAMSPWKRRHYLELATG